MNPPLTAAAEIAALSAAELAAASRIWFGQCCRALLKKGLVTPVKKRNQNFYFNIRGKLSE